MIRTPLATSGPASVTDRWVRLAAGRRIRPELATFTVASLALAAVAGAALPEMPLVAGGVVFTAVLLAAPSLPVGALVTLLLIVRVITDDNSSTDSRQSALVNTSVVIAATLLALAAGFVVRGAMWGRLSFWLAIAFMATFTAVAVLRVGMSSLVLREGLRELSLLALAVIALAGRSRLTPSRSANLVLLCGLPALVVTLQQLVSGTGMDVGGDVRANGTFSHPNSAGLYFGIATVCALWLFSAQRRPYQLLALLAYAVAALGTYSLAGIAALTAMAVVLLLRSRLSGGRKLGFLLAVAVFITAFILSPIGGQRIQNELSTSVAASAQGMSTTSLGWRFHNWTVLLPQWESHPWFGIGLGNTVTGGVGLGELPHSEYVRYLVETGVIGVALLICAVVYLIRRLRRLPPGEPHAAGTLGLAVLVGLLVNALTSNTLLYTPAAYAAILLIFAALGEGSGRHTPDLVEVHGLDVPSVTGR